MAVPDPDDFFAQADLLVLPRQPGRALQVDLRRAISASYYGLFHYLLAAAADEFVGKRHRGSWRYGLAYRSIDHRQLKELCRVLQGSGEGPPAFSADLKRFAVAVLQLQDLRHTADYDPSGLLATITATDSIAVARQEVARFAALPAAERKTFLTMLCFKRR